VVFVRPVAEFPVALHFFQLYALLLYLITYTFSLCLDLYALLAISLFSRPSIACLTGSLYTYAPPPVFVLSCSLCAPAFVYAVLSIHLQTVPYDACVLVTLICIKYHAIVPFSVPLVP
jgi:hypothetical protein